MKNSRTHFRCTNVVSLAPTKRVTQDKPHGGHFKVVGFFLHHKTHLVHPFSAVLRMLRD